MTYSSSPFPFEPVGAGNGGFASAWVLEELFTEEEFVEEVVEEGPDLEELERQRAEAEAAERERIATEAFARGFEEGRRAGEEAEAVRLRKIAAAAELALEQIQEGEARWTGVIEENLCALAVGIARQIMDRELKSDPTIVDELIRRALAQFPIDQPLRIRVNSSDLAALTSVSREDGIVGLTGGREVHWMADALVAPGGCVVEGRERIVDGRVDMALERVYRRLTYAHV